MITKNDIKQALTFEKIDEDGLVSISVLRTITDQQTQYLAHHFRIYDGDGPFFDDGLRVTLSSKGNYHSIKIHKDDIQTFLERYFKFYSN